MLKILKRGEGKRNGWDSYTRSPSLKVLPEIRGKLDNPRSESPVVEEIWRKWEGWQRRTFIQKTCINHLWRDRYCAGHGGTMARRQSWPWPSQRGYTLLLFCVGSCRALQCLPIPNHQWPLFILITKTYPPYFQMSRRGTRVPPSENYWTWVMIVTEGDKTEHSKWHKGP